MLSLRLFGVSMALSSSSMLAVQAQAPAMSAPPVVPHAAAAAGSAPVAHKLASTFTNYGPDVGQSLFPVNYLDPVTRIKCGNAAGCTIGAEMMVTLRFLAPPQNATLQVWVDGGQVMQPGQAVMSAPGGDGYAIGSARFFANVTQGVHTVQTIVEVFSPPVTLGAWQVDYRLYNP